MVRAMKVLIVCLAVLGVVPAAAMADVYTQTNAADGNEVVAFTQTAGGSVREAGRFATGGSGTGTGLGNQGAVVVAGGRLFATNAGSDDVSVFAIGRRGLRLVDRTPSGGRRPVSVAVHGRLVYVVNAGGRGSISGYRLRPDGRLARLPGSRRRLSGMPGSGAAQIGFSPSGRTLVVTERETDLIDVYRVRRDGRTTQAATQRSVGATPFGFAFTPRGHLIISEAFDAAADGSATSSYALAGRRLRPISRSVATTETAACWTALTPDGRFAYVTNTQSGTVSGYRVARDGRLRLLDADGRTADLGPESGPTDAAIGADGRSLYTLNAREGTVAALRIGRDGRLRVLGRAGALARGATGLAVSG